MSDWADEKANDLSCVGLDDEGEIACAHNRDLVVSEQICIGCIAAALRQTRTEFEAELAATRKVVEAARRIMAAFTVENVEDARQGMFTLHTGDLASAALDLGLALAEYDAVKGEGVDWD